MVVGFGCDRGLFIGRFLLRQFVDYGASIADNGMADAADYRQSNGADGGRFIGLFYRHERELAAGDRRPGGIHRRPHDFDALLGAETAVDDG